jgi:hypothetical protein
MLRYEVFYGGEMGVTGLAVLNGCYTLELCLRTRQRKQ